MSRKRTEKSNIRIGIFTDKSAKYNLAVLEALAPNDATSWQIAETLQKSLKAIENKEARFYRTQKIYSVIQRKNGRLDDLNSKGYIRLEGNKWKLALKGLIALGVKRPELVDGYIQARKEGFIGKIREDVDTIPDDPINEPLGIQIDLSKIKPKLAKIDPTQILPLIIDEAKSLLSEGIELDTIKKETLLTLVAARRSLQDKVRRIVEGL